MYLLLHLHLHLHNNICNRENFTKLTPCLILTCLILTNGLSEKEPSDKYEKFVTNKLKIYGFYFDKNGFAIETSLGSR